MRYINTTDENITFTDVNGRVAIVPKNRVYTHFNVDTITFLLVERYESEGVCLFTTRAEDLQINGVVYTYEQLLSGEGIGEMYSPTGLSIKLVDELPQSGDDSTIYLVPNDKGSYTEYLWLKDNQKWEELGDLSSIDLTNYYTKSEINTMFADYYTQSEIDDMFDGYYTKTEVDDALDLKANVDDVYDKTTTDSTFATQVVVNQEISGRIQADTELQGQINTKADKSDTYTKAQVDEAIQDVVADYVLQSEFDIKEETISTALNELEDTKADKADVYTKSETDQAIADALDDIDLSDYYTKGETNDIILEKEEVVSRALTELHEEKADKTEIPSLDNYYTKSETDSAIETALEDIDLSDYYTKSETDSTFVDKATFDVKEEVISTALNTLENEKQDVLTAGANITIENNVISSTGGTQVQADWNQTDDTAVDFIKNKPIVPDVSDYVEKSVYNQKEIAVAEALTDLNENKADKTDVYSKSEVDSAIETALEDIDLSGYVDKTTFDVKEEVISTALNQLDNKIGDINTLLEGI